MQHEFNGTHQILPYLNDKVVIILISLLIHTSDLFAGFLCCLILGHTLFIYLFFFQSYWPKRFKHAHIHTALWTLNSCTCHSSYTAVLAAFCIMFVKVQFTVKSFAQLSWSDVANPSPFNITCVLTLGATIHRVTQTSSL